jgi:hypothetical protein
VTSGTCWSEGAVLSTDSAGPPGSLGASILGLVST